MFNEIPPEMRALILLMVGMSLLAIGIVLGQAAFAIGLL